MNKSILLVYKTMRKCFECKEYITLESDYEKITYYKNNFHHTSCLLEKMMSRKIGKISMEQATELIESLRKETEDHAFDIIIRNHIYRYLIDHYKVIMLPTYIYQKMEAIFNGTFRNMTCAIPPESLLDMFLRQQTFLDRIYHKTPLDGVSRINYDLAVLIAKYPGYLDWLGKGKADAKETANYVEAIEKKNIDFNGLSKQAKRIEPKRDIFEDDEEEGLSI